MNRAEAERGVLECLAERDEHTYVDRLSIGALVFERTGGTLLASILGDLLNRKLITKPVPDPGPKCQRFRITDSGRLALALADEMEEAS